MKRTLTFLVLMNENKSCDSWILKTEHCFSTLGIQLLAKTRSACMFYYWVLALYQDMVLCDILVCLFLLLPYASFGSCRSG